MAQTWTGWQAAVLVKVPAPTTAANIKFLTDWHAYELSGANDNPLNTTLVVKGSTTFNSAGVQNYPTPTKGAQATAATLTNGFYPNIVTALKEGDPYTYPAAPAVGVELTRWGTPRFAAAYLALVSPPQPGPTFPPPTQPTGRNSPRAWHHLSVTLGGTLQRSLAQSQKARAATLRALR